MTINSTNAIPPTRVRDLTPDACWLFAPMHVSTALTALATGMLLTTREVLAGPGHKLLGEPDKVRQRLHVPMPSWLAGKVADYAPFSFTPRTPAALGSCGPRLAKGAERILPGDIVIAVISLGDLIRNGAPVAFADRLPTGSDTEMFPEVRLDLVPWPAIQESKFGVGVSASERLHYNAELLVWEGLEIDAGVQFAVADRSAADALKERCSRAVRPLLRPGWVFSA